METISAEEFKKRYGAQGSNFPEAKKQDSLFATIGKTLARTPIQIAKAGVGLTDLVGSKLTSDPERKAMLEERGRGMIQSPTFGETPNYSVTEGIGKGFELGSYAVGGGGVKGVAQAGVKGLIKEGAIQGAKTGLGAGLAAGFGQGLQGENPNFGSVAKATALGGVGGALTGGVIGGVTGGVGSLTNKAVDTAEAIGTKAKGAVNTIKGKVTNQIPNEEAHLQAVTPKLSELTPTEYDKFLSQGKIQPKTTLEPAKYILSEEEKATAGKYKHLLSDKDPVKNTINVVSEISSKDKQVGEYLQKNNGIFNNGELKNYIINKLQNIDDITIDPTRLAKAKDDLATNFVTSLKKNDQVTLWKARKAFDKTIEKAFSGSPTLQNTMKREFRNAVQDFISESTDNTTYKGYMKDMTELFNVKDVLATKATKERSLSGITKWMKDHPTEAKMVGYGAAALGGTKILKALTD